MAVPATVAVAPPSPVQAQAAPEATGRLAVLDRWEAGGPAVRRAAELALAGTDADVAEFFGEHLAKAQEADARSQVEELAAGGGPGLRAAAAQVLEPSGNVTAFLNGGWRLPWRKD